MSYIGAKSVVIILFFYMLRQQAFAVKGKIYATFFINPAFS
jgi:hypothetical protein